MSGKLPKELSFLGETDKIQDVNFSKNQKEKRKGKSGPEQYLDFNVIYQEGRFIFPYDFQKTSNTASNTAGYTTLQFKNILQNDNVINNINKVLFVAYYYEKERIKFTSNTHFEDSLKFFKKNKTILKNEVFQPMTRLL